MSGVSSKHYRDVIDNAEHQVKRLIKLYICNELSNKAFKSEIATLINNIRKTVDDEEMSQRLIDSIKSAVKNGLRVSSKLLTLQFNVSVLPIIAIVANGYELNVKDTVKLRTYVDKSKNAKAFNVTANDYKSLKHGYIEIGQPLQKWSKQYMSDVHNVYNEIISIPFKPDYDSNVSMRNIAEMRVRQEWHDNQLVELKASGVNLVWINSHADCSERCEPYQGKLYSLDNSYGSIDNVRYRPLSIATDVEYVTKRGKRYKNGCTSGFNCRHYLVPYTKGNKPIHVDAETVREQRAITAKQRLYERTIRDNKLRYEFYRDVDAVKAINIRSEIIALNKQYKAFSRDSKRAIYPDRLKER